MFKLEINTDKKSIGHDSTGALCIKISEAANNGLSFDGDKIKVTKGKNGNPGTGGTSNLPGNGIAGEYNKGISILRANSTVSRLKGGDPTSGNEGPLMSDIVVRIKKGSW